MKKIFFLSNLRVTPIYDDKFVVKFTVHDDTIWCSYEFKPSDETTNDEFALIFTLLDKGSDELYVELNK